MLVLLGSIRVILCGDLCSVFERTDFNLRSVFLGQDIL